MGFYLSGVFLCAALNFVRLVITAFGLFSTKSGNFKRVQLYYDITTGGYSKEKVSWKKALYHCVDLLVITPLFSWLAVVWIVILYIRLYINKSPVPEKIKEINYKLSSVELPSDKVKECMNEIASFYGYSDAGFRTLYDSEDDDPNEFVFEPAEKEDDWYSELQLNPSLNKYTIYTHSPDYAGRYTTLFEYKFNSPSLASRVIESKNEYYVDVSYDIKDGVVLENDVRETMSKSGFSTPEKIDEKIESLKKEVEWQEVNSRFKYFIMFRHGDIFKDADLKKYYRSEIERIKSGYTAMEQEIAKLGGQIVPPDFDEYAKFSRIRWVDDTPQEKVDALREFYDDVSKFNMTNSEFYDFDRITKELTHYLSRLD